MMKNEFFNIKDLENQLNKVFYIKNTSFSAVRLIFLKYVTDNLLGAETKEDMQYFARLQRQLAARDVGGGPNCLYPVLECVDRHYGLNGIIKRTINDYASELFDLDNNWRRKTASLDGYESIMDVLSRFDLEEQDDTHKKGKILVEELIQNIQFKGFGNKMLSTVLTRQELSKIASGILKVQEGEVFLDFTAGIGTSTVTIVNDKACRIISSDINEESCSLAAMLFIMKGYKDFDIKCEDSLSVSNSNYKADKVFVDAPLGLKINSLSSGSKTESSLVAIDKAMLALDPNGMAVVTINNNILFGSSKSQIVAKKSLIDNKYLKAVISLPVCIYGTTLNINFVVLSKNNNSGVLFVNGNSKLFSKSILKDKTKGTTLSDSGIDFVIDIVNNLQKVEQISNIVSYEEIASNEYNLMPTTYVKENVEIETISIEEIDVELAKLYAQLGINNM